MPGADMLQNTLRLDGPTVSPADRPIAVRSRLPLDGWRSPGRAGAVLLLGNYRPTLTLARELARLGLKVLVAGRCSEGAAEWSRFCADVIDIADPEHEPAAFLAGLERCLAERSEIGTLLPVTEAAARVLSERAGRLSDRVLLAMPAPHLVAHCLDKPRLFGLAASLGLPVAQGETVLGDGPNPYAALLDAAVRTGFPLVLRPLDSTRRINGEKALIAADMAALADALPAWPPGQEGLILQRKVSGLRHNLYFAARRGRLIRLAEAVILRTDRVDGTGLAVEGTTIVPDETRVGYLRALLRALDYSGVGCAQFLVDPASGEASFLEINPRIAGHHALAEALGLELSRLAIALAAAGGDEPLRIGPAGVRYAWTYGDLRGLATAWRAGRLSFRGALAWGAQIAWAACRCRVHMTWRWADPVPSLVLYARQARLRPHPAPPSATGTRHPA